MKRLALFLALLVGLAGPPAAMADDARPDIFVIMLDDMGWDNERVLSRLPTVRSMFLEGGLRFDRAFGETPLCCPARATFLTGQHTRHHQVTDNSKILSLDPTYTIATALHDVGYFTIHAGKYLNGAWKLANHVQPGWDSVAMMASSAPTTRWWVNNVESVSSEPDDRLVLDYSVNMLHNAPADSPVFMWVSPLAPHLRSGAWPDTPWESRVEPRYEGDARCADVAPWKPPLYRYSPKPNGFPLVDICESLLTIDENVAALKAEADAQGRDPIWLFTSDNGLGWGWKGVIQKDQPQAVRIPMYMAGPGIGPGKTGALISTIDVPPTLAALAGTTMPRADGLSFEAVLSGGAGPRTWMLEDHPTFNWWAIRTTRWHMIVRPGVSTRLFDYAADPWEKNVLYKPKVKRRLRALFPY